MGSQVPRKMGRSRSADWHAQRRVEDGIRAQHAKIKLRTVDQEIKPVAKKFAEMKIGEQFMARGERLVKSTELSYRSLDNPTMGEYPAGPILDKSIDQDPVYIKTKTSVTKDPELLATEAAVAAGVTRTKINVKKAVRMPPPLGVPKKGVTVTKDEAVGTIGEGDGNIHIPIKVKKARPTAR